METPSGSWGQGPLVRRKRTELGGKGMEGRKKALRMEIFAELGNFCNFFIAGEGVVVGGG